MPASKLVVDIALSTIASLFIHVPLVIGIIFPPLFLLVPFSVYSIYYFILYRKLHWRIIRYQGEWAFISSRWFFIEFLHAFFHGVFLWIIMLFLYLSKWINAILPFACIYIFCVLLPSTFLLMVSQISISIFLRRRFILKLQYNMFKDEYLESEFETNYGASDTDSSNEKYFPNSLQKSLKDTPKSVSAIESPENAKFENSEDELTLDDESFDGNLSLGGDE